MATGGEASSSRNSDSHHLVCRVCEESFGSTGLRTPRLLLCGHTLCETCLVKLLADSHIVCPFDRQLTYVPLGGVVELNKNFALLEVLETLASASGKDKSSDSAAQSEAELIRCDENEQHVATLYCLTCATNLCSPCAEAIHSTKTLSRHKRIPVWETPKARPQCSLHPGHCVELACLEPGCQAQPLMCYLCRDFSSHRGHKFNLLTDSAESIKCLVSDYANTVRSFSEDITNCVRQISVCVQHIEGTTSRADRDETSIRGSALVARQQVHDYFEDLRHSLRRQEEVALSVVNTFVREKKCALQQNIESLTLILSRITAIGAELEKKSSLSDVDLILRRSDICKLIESAKSQQSQFCDFVGNLNCDPSVPVTFTRDNRVHIGPKIEMRLVMLGLNNAGKTSILFKLKQNEFVATIPTIGFNVETVEFKNLQFNVWDVGGDPKLRPLWKHYYLSTQALIFVVDSADRSRLGEAHGELSRLMLEKDLRGAILLVLANKQDNRYALGVEALTHELNLHKICCGRKWHIQACDAQTGVGLEDGLDWLSRQLVWAGVVDVCSQAGTSASSANPTPSFQPTPSTSAHQITSSQLEGTATPETNSLGTMATLRNPENQFSELRLLNETSGSSAESNLPVSLVPESVLNERTPSDHDLLISSTDSSLSNQSS